MKSHITIPNCVLKRFALNNNGFYKYDVKRQVITRGHPRSTFTEAGYYSDRVENIMSDAIEARLSKLYKFANENIAVTQVTLYYRNVGATEWKILSTSNVDNLYRATIFSNELSLEGLEYYIVASDGQNTETMGSAQKTAYCCCQRSISSR